jgi:hypothetical protein
MIPMACEMARWRRNSVHFVVMGRDNISVDGIKEVNGSRQTVMFIGMVRRRRAWKQTSIGLTGSCRWTARLLVLELGLPYGS